MITSHQTALRFTLEAASQLQNNEILSSEVLQDIADDLRKVAEYCEARANQQVEEVDSKSIKKRLKIQKGVQDESN